ncbi:KICSTOR complex protein ITFG2-like [Saccostrea cucullata]|uniref:KICSTOR complex protein ITFG2-like n=1 Tax=Saccostrea cuccullata TaxID=36930 RepID=UPI002ED281DC
MWRNVSFVERIELDFSGNLFNHAIVLGDVDNDQGHELVVGNTDGELAIFKGTSRSPWKRCSGLGMITCIGVGDVFNKGKNVLVVLTAEGWCNIFDIKSEPATDTTKDPDTVGENITPSFTQHLPANGKVLLIEDVDGDGKVELTVAYSDRVVRCFRWSTVQDPETEIISDNLIQTQKWQLAGQISSLTVNFTEDGHPELLVAQPGGDYVTMTFKQGSEIDLSGNEGYNEEVLKSDQRANQTVSTEILGGISKQRTKQPGTYYAICTLDGNLLLVEKKQILWSLQVDHQLFSLKKLDVTGNGKEEVVCCSWDGQTYIVNHNRAVVRYQFQENVTAFTAGLYGGDNNPSFVYATYNNKIYIYNNIQLPQVESTNLIEVMERRENTQELLEKIGLQDPHPSQLRDLYHWLLYGWRGYT